MFVFYMLTIICRRLHLIWSFFPVSHVSTSFLPTQTIFRSSLTWARKFVMRHKKEGYILSSWPLNTCTIVTLGQWPIGKEKLIVLSAAPLQKTICFREKQETAFPHKIYNRERQTTARTVNAVWTVMWRLGRNLLLLAPRMESGRPKAHTDPVGGRGESLRAEGWHTMGRWHVPPRGPMLAASPALPAERRSMREPWPYHVCPLITAPLASPASTDGGTPACTFPLVSADWNRRRSWCWA